MELEQESNDTESLSFYIYNVIYSMQVSFFSVYILTCSLSFINAYQNPILSTCLKLT